jgi:hypothetical protein
MFRPANRRGSPLKSEGVGGVFIRGQGENFPLWVWEKPKVLCTFWRALALADWEFIYGKKTPKSRCLFCFELVENEFLLILILYRNNSRQKKRLEALI